MPKNNPTTALLNDIKELQDSNHRALTQIFYEVKGPSTRLYLIKELMELGDKK